jgi:hypothetical protein
VFGILVLTAILVSILQLIPTALFGAVGALIAAGSSQDVESLAALFVVVSSLGAAVGFILFGALTFIATTLLYLDLRVRKEALDLELMAAQVGPAGEASTP